MTDASTGDQFDRLARYISPALALDGNHTLEDVRAMLDRGELQLWPGRASVLVTQIIDTPQVRYLHFFLAGGNLDEVRALYPIAVAWGKSRGCTRASMCGRKGWERTFLTRDEGWTSRHIYMTKELSDE